MIQDSRTSTKEAARAIGVHWVTLLRWIESGSLRPPKLVEDEETGVKHWRWGYRDIERAREYKEDHGRWPNDKARKKRERANARWRADVEARAEKAKPEPETEYGHDWASRILAMLQGRDPDLEANLKILGLTGRPTIDEVKSTYRALVHVHHPDKGGNPEAFMKITKAYQSLVKVML
jgi:hypothetical protein